jgi:LysR family nitrogen assimilation transcriptional regulator
MDLRQLRYFVTVANCGSFTAAARQLCITQPALGLQVKQLERRLGTSLLARHSRGVTLTKAGTVLLPHADAILENIAQAEASLQAFKSDARAKLSAETTEIRLGVLPSTTRSIVPELMEACERTMLPSVRIGIQQGFDGDLLRAAEDKKLDMIFCYEPPGSSPLDVLPLYVDELILVGPPKMVRSQDGDVLFRDLPQFPLIMSRSRRGARALVEETAGAKGIELKIRYEVEAAGLKRELLRTERCCTIVSSAMFLGDLRNKVFGARRIVEPALSRKLCLVSSRDLPSDVLEFVQSTVRQIVERRHAERLIGWRRLPGEERRLPEPKLASAAKRRRAGRQLGVEATS